MPQDRLLTVNIEQIPLFKDILGVPGIHIKPLRLDAERGEWVFMAICAPGCALPLHYHTGPAQVWTIQGRWEYREYPGQPQVAGSYLHEPGGSVHTFFCPDDNTEDTIALAQAVEGAAMLAALSPWLRNRSYVAYAAATTPLTSPSKPRRIASPR